MSKSIGKVFGSGSSKAYGYEKNYTNYLQNYDTSNYDNTLRNMTQTALAASQKLGSLPEYQFSADGSDEARQRAENATYQSYVDKLTPQYRQQTSDLAARLANQGISVGSEAYQRAMGDLQEKQNEALQQAAYQSVLQGQNALSQSLNDSLKNSEFSNNAQQNYINQIMSLLSGSVSGYSNAANLYDVQRGVQSRVDANNQQGLNNFINLGKTAAKFF